LTAPANEIKKAVSALKKNDQKLREVMEKVGPCRLTVQHMQSPFDSLAKAIVYQQLSGKAAASIMGKVRNIYGHPESPLEPEEILGTADDTLRSAGLSRAKLAGLKDLALKAQEGVVPSLAELEEMTDEEIIERLISVRGIGKWTVEMMLIFRLGRLDVMPSTDYGIRKGFALTYRKRELPPPKQIEKYAERWRPYRTIASWYLWRALEL